jgi:hypothetical protein
MLYHFMRVLNLQTGLFDRNQTELVFYKLKNS